MEGLTEEQVKRINDVLKSIRNIYNEDMHHLCKHNFTTILEKKPELLLELLQKYFPVKETATDLKYYESEKEFIGFINKKSGLFEKKGDINPNVKTPEELLKEAGYTLIECHSAEEIAWFERYYAPGEELCTFGDPHRIDKCYVFFAIKDNVEEIKREDFSNPERQDLYGTSVISIQFTRDDSNILSIKNRYNHRVPNPDATFSNDLEKIVPGLTQSFEVHKNIKEKYQARSPKGFVLGEGDNDETKYYPVNCTTNGYSYCSGGYIIDQNFSVVTDYLNTTTQIMVDNFIVDQKNKRIYCPDSKLEDDFLRIESDIKDIEITKDVIEVEKTKYNEETQKEEKYTFAKAVGKIIKITHNDGTISMMKIDQSNRLVGYINNSITEIKDNFLMCNKNLKELELANVEKIGNGFMAFSEGKFEVHLPNVKEIGDTFLARADNIRVVDLPNVEVIGNDFCFKNLYIDEIQLPKVRSVGNGFLTKNQKITEVDFPELEIIGEDFLGENESLKSVNLAETAKSR